MESPLNTWYEIARAYLAGAVVVNDDFMTMHITSAAFSGRDRVEAFRETYGRQLMQLEIDPHPDHPFELDFIRLAVADTQYTYGGNDR
jgi:hypothetical protein